MSRLNNNISKNSPDNATQNFAERDGRECKKLVEAYRDWLLAYGARKGQSRQGVEGD